MNFDRLYNRVLNNEAKEKQKREENVEQYDHSASAAEQEEEYDDNYREGRDEDYSKKSDTWQGSDIKLNLPSRSYDCVVEGTVFYVIEEERPGPSNGYIGSKWPEVEDIEVTGIYQVGDENTDAVDITEDVTFEEMELAEAALQRAFERDASDSWFE